MELQRIKNLVVYYATLSDEPCNETIFSCDSRDSQMLGTATELPNLSQISKPMGTYQ